MNSGPNPMINEQSMSTVSFRFLAATLTKVTVALGAVLALSGCAADGDSEDGSTPRIPNGAEEELVGDRSEAAVRGCTCPGKGKCSDLSYSDIPADNKYIITTFAEGGPMGCSTATKKTADGTWAYIADSARFGCGAKVRVTANGKSCVAEVADCGPNRCVEDAAGAPAGSANGTCNKHFPIIDASPLITKYLFGASGAGWSDRMMVTTVKVDSSTPIGCGSAPAPDPNAERECSKDSDCNHNTSGTGVVCDPAKYKCVDGCRRDADCGSGATCSSNDGKTLGKCSDNKPELGSSCSSDKDCSGGKEGSARICDPKTKTCATGCNKNEDCGGGSGGDAKSYCDKSLSPYTCVTRKELGDDCSSDKDCHGSVDGTQRVCSKTTKKCIDACYADSDCGASSRCDTNTNKCVTVAGECVLNYPLVSIQGIKVPASVKNEYSARGCAMPFQCVIDANNIKDAKTGKTLSYNQVKLSEHFTLRELTATSVARSPYIYVGPELITHLELWRNGYGKAININSGFRSAAHQKATCMSMCGKASCSGTCALCSNHMSGMAVDTKHSNPKCALAGTACKPGKFDFIYNEKSGGDHLHVEMKTTHPAQCLFQDISCKLAN